MSDEQLNQIRAYLDYPAVQWDEAMLFLGRLLPPLLADYERLRAENAMIRDREAAARNDMHVALEEVRRLNGISVRVILRMVADGDMLTSTDNGGDNFCNVCGAMLSAREKHAPECMVMIARELLGPEYANGNE